LFQLRKESLKKVNKIMNKLYKERVLAFDPGNNTGWALISKRHGLLDAGLIEFKNGLPVKNIHGFPPASADRVIIEKPRIYSKTKKRVDPNDSISVALVGGFCAGVCLRDAYTSQGKYAEIEYVFPQDWKGGRPKDIDNEYTWGLMSPHERDVLTKQGFTKKQIHNVLDAIGIGFWAVGRR